MFNKEALPNRTEICCWRYQTLISMDLTGCDRMFLETWMSHMSRLMKEADYYGVDWDEMTNRE